MPRPFPVGHKYSVGRGRPALPAEIRELRRTNQAALIRLVTQYLSLTAEDVEQRQSGPCTQLEEALQGVIKRAKEGDSNAFKYLMEVLCGKIPDADESPVDKLTDEEKLEAAEKMVSKLREKIQGGT